MALEVLTGDFKGDTGAVDVVLAAGPDVFAHNLETVPRLSRQVRVQASYARSYAILRHAKARGAITKTGLMLGLGEELDEVRAVLRELREIGVDILTLGPVPAPVAQTPARRALRARRTSSPRSRPRRWRWDSRTSSPARWSARATTPTASATSCWRCAASRSPTLIPMIPLLQRAHPRCSTCRSSAGPDPLVRRAGRAGRHHRRPHRRHAGAAARPRRQRHQIPERPHRHRRLHRRPPGVGDLLFPGAHQREPGRCCSTRSRGCRRSAVSWARSSRFSTSRRRRTIPRLALRRFGRARAVGGLDLRAHGLLHRARSPRPRTRRFSWRCATRRARATISGSTSCCSRSC